jgi:hypothetical protein
MNRKRKWEKITLRILARPIKVTLLSSEDILSIAQYPKTQEIAPI